MIKNRKMKTRIAKRARVKGSKPPKGQLARRYLEYFLPSPNAIDQKSQGSLEQPSPFQEVPSVITYDPGERPIMVGGFDA
jgi:hypothetical protein